MNILFLGYWGYYDGLTTATILPHLKILSSLESINKIIFCSIERSDIVFNGTELNIDKVSHIPLYTKNYPLNIVNKISDFVVFPNQIKRICMDNNIDHIIARGSPAGALAYLATRRLKIPFSVESYEPHADYMLNNGVWKWYDPRFIFQKHWEKKIKQSAKAIMPVSKTYINRLESEGVDAQKLHFMPCSVDIPKYSFKSELRMKLRFEHAVDEHAVVGIYVGKFGGIYYEDPGFQIFKKAFQIFGPNHFLIILTPQNKTEVLQKIKNYSIPENRTFIGKVSPDKVPEYLSMADFAYCLHQPSESSIAFSPIKNGEYFAAGLPVIIADSIGDDSELVEKFDLGAVFYDGEITDDCFYKIKSLLSDKNLKDRIKNAAEEFRSFRIQAEVYTLLFG